MNARKIVDRLLEDEQYHVFRHYYEKADSIWEGWFLQGPGLEPYYNEDGYAEWGHSFTSSVDVDDDSEDGELIDSIDFGAYDEFEPQEFSDVTGHDISEAVEYVKSQSDANYEVVDL